LHLHHFIISSQHYLILLWSATSHIAQTGVHEYGIYMEVYN